MRVDKRGRAEAVAKLDGYLTQSSGRRPSDIVTGYLRAHQALFATKRSDIDRLHLVRRYTTRGAAVRLIFEQTYRGLPVAGSGLSATVTAQGRLVNVYGAPNPDPDIGSTQPQLNRRQAIEAVERTIGKRRVARAALVPRFRSGERAKLEIYSGGGQDRLAWRVLAYSASGRLWDLFVDATDGTILHRHSLTNDAQALVFENYPGAPVGGAQHTVSLTPYLFSGTATLDGPNSFTWADVDDDDNWQTAEQTPTSDGTNFNYSYVPFNFSGGNCRPSPYYCSWNHNVAWSWIDNIDEASTQAFWHVNKFHDHLLASPIEFTPEKGGFVNPYQLYVKTAVGAAIENGLPGSSNVNNSFMLTPPYSAPLMRLLLFRPTSFWPYSTINSADDAATIYHEYTHGLSARLVVDADGVSTLGGHQADSMNEGWSDWYALDFLVKQGYMTDTATNGEIRWAQYLSQTLGEPRSQPYDCPVGAAAAQCPGDGTAGSGGYTYGDMGKVAGFVEPHADGEIWAETLWDLRRRLIADHGTTEGVRRAELLVTGAMELSPASPSFLDMRDAVLQADTAFDGGADHTAIWSVFAARGMGYFASAIDTSDPKPVENFSTPPAPSGTGTVNGIVQTEQGIPIRNAHVYLGGHVSGLPEDISTTTNFSGQFTLSNVPVGTYQQVIARADRDGLEPAVATNVTVTANSTVTRNFTLTRDWASLGAGSTIIAHTGEIDCDPEAAIDQYFDSSWSTSSPARPDEPGSKYFTVQLPAAVDISSFVLDPAAHCESGTTAAVGQYRVEVSTNGSSFTTSASGTFTESNNGQRNVVAPAAGTGTGVRFVRFVGLSTQNQNPGYGGAERMDLTELQVFGTPRAGARVTAGVLRYEGTPGVNNVTISQSGGSFTVQDTAATMVPGSGCSTVTANSVSCPGAGVTSIIADGGAGNDSLTNSTSVGSKLLGGEGNDTVVGGMAADTVDGGMGGDTLRGMNGNDRLLANDGTIDQQINCDGGTTPGNADTAEVDSDDPATTGCEGSGSGYARPQSATPMRVALVPAFRYCGYSNASHGSPLATESCVPPIQESSYLTVGTPDLNGQTANSVGWVQFKVVGETPINPSNGDQADVQVQMSMTDVRRKSDLGDYTGQLTVGFLLTITDRQNGPSGNGVGTADSELSFPVGCMPTADTTIGSTCATTTTFDAITPSVIKEGKRSVWGMGAVFVYDGGRDGLASTHDNTPFAMQGMFIP